MFLSLLWGLKTTQNSIRTTSDLDRSHLMDTLSEENDRIGADTDPGYRIDAFLVYTVQSTHNASALTDFSQHGNTRAVSQDMGNSVTSVT